jgi:hypothetical protein
MAQSRLSIGIRSKLLNVAATAGILLMSLGSSTQAAFAATTSYSLKNLAATVNGTSVTATATVAASVKTTATYAGICVRDAAGNNHDFNKAQNVTLTTTGTVLNGPAQTLAPGTYSYFACIYVKSVWISVGATKSFTIGSTAPTTYTLDNLAATVSGTSVTATATVAASVNTTAQSAGICVNDASNNSFNFPMNQNVVLTTSGTVLNGAAQTLVPGTYTYYACITVQNVLSQVGSTKTFTVSSQTVPTTYALNNLSATVNGTSVTATATVAASVSTTAQSAGICVRDASNNNFDFTPIQNVVLTTNGTVLNGATQTLVPGTYTYYACITVQNVLSQVGNSQNFMVSSVGGSLPYASALSGYTNLAQSFTAKQMTTPDANSKTWAQYADATQEGGNTCSTTDATYDATNDAVELSTNGLPTNQSGASCGHIRSATTVPTINSVVESKIYLPGTSATTMLDWASFWTDGTNASGVENWPITGEVDAVETNFGRSYISIHCGCMADYNAASYGPTEVWTTEPSGWEDKDTTYATTSAPNIGPGWTVVDIAFNSDGTAGIYYNGTLYVTVPASVLTWNTGSTYVNWGISGAYAAETQSNWPTGAGAEEVQYMKVFTK